MAMRTHVLAQTHRHRDHGFMASIRQNWTPDRLPDTGNVGVLARILIGACLFGLVIAVDRARSLGGFLSELTAIASTGLPPLLLVLCVLALGSRWLRSLPYRLGAIVILVGSLILVSAGFVFERAVFGGTAGPIERYWLFTAILAALLLAYLDLHERALSPALTEARLQALQARIRPHFLFNSINAVLSLIRSEPKRAETALEDMADLFRVLMADNRELTTLAREIELCREYLDLEQLRLGDRLQVEWYVDKMPADAMVPPLVL